MAKMMDDWTDRILTDQAQARNITRAVYVRRLVELHELMEREESDTVKEALRVLDLEGVKEWT